MRKTSLIALMLALICLLTGLPLAGAVAEDAVTVSSISDLPVEAVFGANPDLPYFTVVACNVKDGKKGRDIVATISANETLTEFELICEFYKPQKVMLTVVDGEITMTRTTNNGIGNSAPEVLQAALDQNIWVSTAECELPYTDPAPEFSKPAYIVAGVYEEDFERANPNLNGLAMWLDDEDLARCKEPCAQQGTVEEVVYDTYYYAKDAKDGDVLSHATPIQKTAYVYLPYGYDPDGQYNVLYLLHGGGDSERTWLTQYDGAIREDGASAARNILDNLIAEGRAVPCIVVTPGLYYSGDNGEISGFSDDLTANFGYELLDLMRVVEDRYATYAETTDDEGLIASRDHRALAGLSMGSVTTWESGIAASLDYISWFGNMSGGPAFSEDATERYITETVIPALDAAAEKGHAINMMLQFNGTQDQALPPHVRAHKVLMEYMNESDVLRLGENYDFVVSDGDHMFSAWNLYLYDMMQVFFR